MRTFRKTSLFFFLLSLIVFPFFFLGCETLGTYNAATEKREFIFISSQAETQMGQESHLKVTEQYPLSQDTNKIQRLERIGRSLAAVSDRKDYEYHFYLIEKEELNAFTTPGGNIYFLTGLFDQLKSDDAIAAVVAHEIGHCAARHIAKKFQAALGYSVISSLALYHAGLGDQARQIASMSSNALMNLVFSAFSRKDEYEADHLSIKYMYLAGYRLDGIIEAFEFLLNESKGPRLPLWLSTHPFMEDRIKIVRQEIGSAPEKYQSLKNP